MITVTQYSHFPNNTELGKGNTHECYFLVPNRFDLSNIFPSGVEVSVVDVHTQKTYLLKSAHGREFRINQLGQFYRDYDVHMGDEITFTHIKGEIDEKIYIGVRKYNRAVIILGKNDAEIINVERLKPFAQGTSKSYNLPINLEDGENISITISFKEARAKRTDSPILTDFYTVQCDNCSLNSGTYFLTLGESNTLLIANKTTLKVFPFDETIVGSNTIDKKSIIPSSLPLQQIFYGAPGTGKSHKVKEVTDTIAKEFVFRTTFHPDSDYSTFVGAYKPTMEYPNNKAYTVGQLIDKLSEIKNTGCTYPCQKFAAKYWYALKQLSATEIKEIISACGFTDSMKVEIDKSIPVGEELAKHNADSKIVYSFVPQAFLKAYVAAWQNLEQPVFLVIEEINRGNCAQIFGDIFQLLDRKDGVSEYPIKADQDIRDYLAKEFAGYDLEANILSGEKLVLPANLHIWATMNTSDQSLFPIDSAFKRRWDWKYMPIHDPGENWTIALSDVEYDWWDFVEKINNVIGNMTSSEDKKLGYFFCKACNGKIDAETFVNKVIFYLWNDVFKDYELSDKAFQDGEGKLTFNKFYTPSGDANEATIKTLLENLEVKKEVNEIEQPTE